MSPCIINIIVIVRDVNVLFLCYTLGMDTMSPEARHNNMSHIKSVSKPEVLLRSRDAKLDNIAGEIALWLEEQVGVPYIEW